MITKILSDFGLTDKQIEMYLFICKTGSCTASQTSSALNIQRTEAYRIVKELLKKGLVETTLEYPKHLIAIPFEQVINLFIKEKKEEVVHLEKKKDQILSLWKSVKITKPESSSEKFMLLKGRTRICSKILRMIEETNDEFLIITTATGILRFETIGLINSLIKHNIKSRILTDISLYNNELFNRICTLEKKYPMIRVRHAEFGIKLFPRIIIKDKEKAILFITQKEDKLIKPQDEASIWTDCKPFVNTLTEFFEKTWHNSIDWHTRIAMIKEKLSCAMRSPAISVSISDPILEIIDKMVKNNIGSVIVIHNHKPIGIITESDILKRAFKQQKKINEKYAKDIMSTPIFTIEYDNDLTDALKLMREKHVRRLAITKNGELVGIITERRLLNAQICPGLMKITL